MALERLIGTAGLNAMTDQDPIASTNRQLGYNFKTNAANKRVAGAWVRMNAAGNFVAGTKWQLWKRATPISSSALLQNIEIGGGIVSGAAGSEQPVPGVAATALVQNDFYMYTIYHPSTQAGNYSFKNAFGNPASGSLSGNNIFKNGAANTVPPDDETFTNGGFAVDIGIDDITSDITATLNFTLPLPTLAFGAQAIASGTLNFLLPVLTASFTAARELRSENLRQYIWTLLKDDPEMNMLGINGNSLFGTNATDSPAASLQKWAIIRWGSKDAPLGRDTTSGRKLLSVWAYDRRRDYGDIDKILRRACTLIVPLEAVQYSNEPGFITAVTDNGYSDDLWDDGYSAVTKNWQATIIASGL